MDAGAPSYGALREQEGGKGKYASPGLERQDSQALRLSDGLGELGAPAFSSMQNAYCGTFPGSVTKCQLP